MASPQGQSEARKASGTHSNRLDNPQWTSFWSLSDHNLKIADEVRRVAEEVGCTPSQVALNWLRVEDAIPIIGARTVNQVVENLDCLNFTLAESQLERLASASRIDLGFPHDFTSWT